MKNIFAAFLSFLIVLSLFFPTTGSADTKSDREIDQKRNQLIGYILSKQLPTLHFSNKEFNAELSEAIFHLYIKQLDFQKRFLLQGDVDHLRAFESHLGKALINGRTALPDTGYDILSDKIDLVQGFTGEMLANDTLRKSGEGAGIDITVGDFDLQKDESYETDPEKVEFSKNVRELKDRWRKIIKAQIITEYLDLKADQEKDLEKDKEEDKTETAKSEDELWKEAIGKIRKRNASFFLRLHQETLQDHYDRFYNSVTRAFGPHTNYIPPASKEQFDISMRGSLEGIGALLREDDGFIKVVRIIPGSASALQGRLKAEDVILEVAQEDEEPIDITDMRLRDAVRLIRGPKGEAVSLTVRKPDGNKEVIRIIRDVVQIEETFVKSTLLEAENGRKTGYVYIPSFYRDFEGTRNGSEGRNSTDDTRKAIQHLKEQGIDGLVLDLRDDGGGALIDAVDIAGLFIKGGPVVQVKNSFGEKKILEDKDNEVFYAGPLVVLVNQFSASASEIVAAALQDYNRAVIVGGTHTHGKGTVQTILNLNDNIPLLHLRKYEDLGALKVMIQKFYRVNGSSTQYKGVESDIVLPNLYEHIKSGERYLDYSLPWDSIEAVPYTPWKATPFDLSTLREKSLKRASKDEGLRIIQEEAEKAGERSKDTTLSIKFDDMREKRLESELTREKVGAHYRKYREEEGDDLDNGFEDETKDSKETWLKDVNDDPYIREAVNIIGDIIQQSEK